MLKISVMFVVAITLAGCASCYENQEAAFQRALPQLVADCNDVFGGSARSVKWRDGVNACHRLSQKRSIGLVEPETVESYSAYHSRRGTYRYGLHRAQHGISVLTPGMAIPAPLPQVQ